MKINIKLVFLILSLIFLGGILIGFCYLKFGIKKSEVSKGIETKAKGIMLLIEYKDTIGLSNFVNEMQKRNIPGLLMVTPEFVQKNCETIKEITKHNVEIVASNIGAPFWDIPYEEQKTRILEMKQGIESCTGIPIRIISSTYMASDATTIKVAHELGIPYVTARGTTDTKATVYQVEDYPDVKILSVSNIPKVQYKYGSLCDYSYFERNGTPNDMMEELTRAIEPLTLKEQARYGPYHKITPTTHTNIGGYLKPWMDMWINFWDTTKDKIRWVNLDEFMADVDWVLPLWQIPINKNNPYTPEKIRPVTSYEETEKVQNPCLVEDIGKSESERKEQVSKTEKKYSVGNKIIMFHNGKGPMCLEALEFLKTINYPIEQYLDYEEGFKEKLDELKTKFGSSEGVHPLFGYYPIIFIKDRAFSGFNETIKNEILKEIGK
jgi:peptidoglycan/xylan/chitin deacetylase (PgdA/CDA1 family)